MKKLLQIAIYQISYKPIELKITSSEVMTGIQLQDIISIR